ncbi:MAG TPA: hypothetical protein VNK94_09530 [Gaiellaceae bacterium]|nr:hypothetical protein [Gaiellaceae bacterium]
MAPVAGVVAHGGAAGALVEAAIGLAVLALFVAVWLRERRSREPGGERSARLRDDEQD